MDWTGRVKGEKRPEFRIIQKLGGAVVLADTLPHKTWRGRVGQKENAANPKGRRRKSVKKSV